MEKSEKHDEGQIAVKQITNEAQKHKTRLKNHSSRNAKILKREKKSKPESQSVEMSIDQNMPVKCQYPSKSETEPNRESCGRSKS